MERYTHREDIHMKEYTHGGTYTRTHIHTEWTHGGAHIRRDIYTEEYTWRSINTKRHKNGGDIYMKRH